MRGMWSQMEDAWRDTLVHRAEGTALQDLASLYGVPVPVTETTPDNWSGVLKPIAYGSRGSFQTTFEALKAAFSFLNIKVPGYVEESSSPQVLNSTAGDWPSSSLNRLILKGDKVLFSVGYLNGDKTKLVVADRGTHYWDAPSSDLSGNVDYTFEILPFVVHERSPGRISESEEFTIGEECLVEVIFFTTGKTDIPKSWLYQPTAYGTPGTPHSSVPTPEWLPYGTQALASETVLGNPTGTGPYALYAFSGFVFPGITSSLKNTLAASVELRSVLNPPFRHL